MEKTLLLWLNEPARSFLLHRETCTSWLWDHTITEGLRWERISGGHLRHPPCSSTATQSWLLWTVSSHCPGQMENGCFNLYKHRKEPKVPNNLAHFSLITLISYPFLSVSSMIKLLSSWMWLAPSEVCSTVQTQRIPCGEDEKEMGSMMWRWQSWRLCPRYVRLIDVRYAGLKVRLCILLLEQVMLGSCWVSLTQLGGFVWSPCWQGTVTLGIQLFCKPWHQRYIFTWQFCTLSWCYVCDTRPLQYWSNYLKVLMEKLWLHPLNCFLGKGSEDALCGHAFCQVSYSPMAGNPCRRGLQDSPQQSSTENAGKQTNGSIFWCPMCCCSSPFQYTVSSAWGIKEGGACG